VVLVTEWLVWVEWLQEVLLVAFEILVRTWEDVVVVERHVSKRKEQLVSKFEEILGRHCLGK
jgi:hypothetical protein